MLECRPGRTPFWEYSIHGWSGLHLKIMCWGGNTLLSFIHISTYSMLCSCFRGILGSSSWKVFLDIFLYYFSVGFFSCSDGHSDICNKAVVYNTINVHSCFVLTLKYSKGYQRLIHDTQTRHASAIVFIHVMSQKNLSAILIPYTNTTSQTLCSKYANLWYVPVDQLDKESCDESGPQDSDIKEKWDRTIFCLNCFALSIFAFCSQWQSKMLFYCTVKSRLPILDYITSPRLICLTHSSSTTPQI